MYFVYEQQEVSTEFIYCDLSNQPYISKEGYRLISTFETPVHKIAVNRMLAGRRSCKKHNVGLDPNYIPPSKRT